MDQPIAPITPTPYQISKKKWLFMLLVGIVILTIGIFSGLLISKYIFSTTTSIVSKACTMEAKICPDGSSVGRSGPKCEFAACPTENLKTFTSSRYGYSFSYPSSWYLTTWDETDPTNLSGTHTLHSYDPAKAEANSNHGKINWQAFMGNTEAVKIDISVLESPLEVKDLIKQSETVSINNTAVSVYKSQNDQIYLDYLIKPNEHLVLGIFGYYLQGQNLMSSPIWKSVTQILSTFKFTVQTSVDTSNWETYTTPDKKYSIKHPSNWKVLASSLDEWNQAASDPNFVISNSNNEIKFSFPSGFGPGICVFSDNPDYNKLPDPNNPMLQKCGDYIVINSPRTEYRRLVNPNLVNTDGIKHWIVYAKSPSSSYFVTVPPIEYNLSKNFDPSVLQTMDSIVSTFSSN